MPPITTSPVAPVTKSVATTSTAVNRVTESDITPHRVPNKTAPNTTAPEYHPQPHKTGNSNASHPTAPGPPVPKRRGRPPNRKTGAEDAALLGGGKEASAVGDGVPPARVPANVRFEGSDGDAAPTRDDTQAQVAKQKGRKPKKAGKKAREVEEAPAVGDDEAPAPPKAGRKEKSGNGEQPLPEQAAHLVPSNPAVGAVACAPPSEAYPAPGRSTRKSPVLFDADADDICTGSRRKTNGGEVSISGVEQATLLVPLNPTVGAVVPPTIAHAGRSTRKSLVPLGADADDPYMRHRLPEEKK